MPIILSNAADHLSAHFSRISLRSQGLHSGRRTHFCWRRLRFRRLSFLRCHFQRICLRFFHRRELRFMQSRRETLQRGAHPLYKCCPGSPHRKGWGERRPYCRQTPAFRRCHKSHLCDMAAGCSARSAHPRMLPSKGLPSSRAPRLPSFRPSRMTTRSLLFLASLLAMGSKGTWRPGFHSVPIIFR